MSRVATIHVDLEFDLAADPVEGRLSADGGAPEPFTGWIELAAALERLRVPAAGSYERRVLLRSPVPEASGSG
jgi:hypothetical protein